jgi:hypothetical protein
MGGLANQAYSNQTAAGLGYGNLEQGYQGLANQYALGQGGLQNQLYGMNQNYNLGLGNLGLGYGNLGLGYFNGSNNYNLGLGGLQNTANANDQNFYTQQRGQDLQSQNIGASLYGLGSQGQWSGLQNASGLYAPYTGYGSSTQSQQGGGLTGALGGALGGMQLGNLFSGSPSTGGFAPGGYFIGG